MGISNDTVDRSTLLDKIRRSSMPEKEKRKWTKFIRGIRGHEDQIEEYITKLDRDIFKNG